MKRRGKKTAAWESTRAKLKVCFANAGITRCESCGSTFALSFAHSKKRRFIVTPEDEQCVALLCCRCHDAIECRSHEEMRVAVELIIAGRAEPVERI